MIDTYEYRIRENIFDDSIRYFYPETRSRTCTCYGEWSLLIEGVKTYNEALEIINKRKEQLISYKNQKEIIHNIL